MALHLNLLHEEILQQRQRQRDPLKIGMMVLGALGALMLLYYLWNAYKVLEIRNRLSQAQHDWAKVEPKVTTAQKRSAELNGIISTTKALEDLDTIVKIGGSNQAMARFSINATFGTQATKPSPTPGPRTKIREPRS